MLLLSLKKRIISSIIQKRFNSTLISTSTSTSTTESTTINLTRDSTTSTSTTTTTASQKDKDIHQELHQLLQDNERVRNLLLQQYPPIQNKNTRAPLPVLSITAKKNNTFASISTSSSRDYRVLKSMSAGLLVQGASRGSVEGGSRVGMKIAHFASVEKGVKDVILKLRGFGRGRDAAVRSILQYPGLNVVSIVEASKVQHGGCKPRKVRRV